MTITCASKDDPWMFYLLIKFLIDVKDYSMFFFKLDDNVDYHLKIIMCLWYYCTFLMDCFVAYFVG